MNEENKGMSLREALAAGFDRVEAEESAAQRAEETAPPPQEEAVQETAAEQTAAPTADHVQPETAPAPAVQQTAPDQSAMMMQLIEALRSENAQLRQAANASQAAVRQQSELAETAAAETVTEPQIPALNFRELQYMSDDEQAAALAQWQTAVMEGAAQKAMKSVDPIRQDYEAKQRQAADEAARSMISGRADFSDFTANSQNIERIAALPEFQSMKPETRYMIAALAARGIANNPQNKPAAPTTEQIIEMAYANPDVIRAIETRRAQEVQKKNDELPVLGASSGMGAANPIPENRVKTKADLETRMRARFGL
jgi:hypothetical protein